MLPVALVRMYNPGHKWIDWIESWESFGMVPKPHFLLFCDGQNNTQSRDFATSGSSATAHRDASDTTYTMSTIRGRWRFVLEDLDAGTRLEATDAEAVAAPERTALLAVVRGLEALEQPSRVTLVTTSRYVSRGLQFGLTEWRESDYCWEHFGSVQPIRNADLWRRVDHAMQFHQVTCRWIAGPEGIQSEANATTQFDHEPLVDSDLAPAYAMVVDSSSANPPAQLDRLPEAHTPNALARFGKVIKADNLFVPSRKQVSKKACNQTTSDNGLILSLKTGIHRWFHLFTARLRADGWWRVARC